MTIPAVIPEPIATPAAAPAAAPAEKPVPIVVEGTQGVVSSPEEAAKPDTPSMNALADAFKNIGKSIEDARARAPEPVKAETPTGEQPRDPETGKFVPKEEAPTPEPEAPAPAEAATAEGEEPIGDDEPDPALIVELPLARHPNGTPITMVLDSKESADALRQNLNGALRREQYEAAMSEVNTQRDQLEQQQLALIVDPVSVVQDTLTTEQKDLLILSLLNDDTVLARLGDKLALLGDELGRRELRLETREKYNEERTKATDEVEQRRLVQQNTRQVMAALDAIVPEHLNDAQRRLWLRDARMDLSSVARQHNLLTLDPMAIPTALNARLVATGVDPADAAEKIARAVYGRRQAAAPTNRVSPPSALPPATPASATPTAGSRPVNVVRAAHERRAAAAATGGAGTGTPTAGGLPALPQSAGLSEAFSLVRTLAGKK